MATASKRRGSSGRSLSLTVSSESNISIFYSYYYYNMFVLIKYQPNLSSNLGVLPFFSAEEVLKKGKRGKETLFDKLIVEYSFKKLKNKKKWVHLNYSERESPRKEGSYSSRWGRKGRRSRRGRISEEGRGDSDSIGPLHSLHYDS